MIAVETIARMSVADYLAFERESEVRHELVLMAQDEPRIEIHRRTSDGWEREIHQGQDGVLPLQSVGLQMPLAMIYA